MNIPSKPTIFDGKIENIRMFDSYSYSSITIYSPHSIFYSHSIPMSHGGFPSHGYGLPSIWDACSKPLASLLAFPTTFFSPRSQPPSDSNRYVRTPAMCFDGIIVTVSVVQVQLVGWTSQPVGVRRHIIPN